MKLVWFLVALWGSWLVMSPPKPQKPLYQFERRGWVAIDTLSIRSGAIDTLSNW